MQPRTRALARVVLSLVSRLPIFFGSTGRPFGATRTSEFATGDKPADVLFGSFYHGRDLCVDVTIVNPFSAIHKKLRDPDSFLQSAVTHKRQNYADRCKDYLQFVRLKCPEAFIFQK